MPWVDGTLVGMGCLLFSSNASMTWNEADVFCQFEQSAKLVSIETEEQVDFVKMVLGMLADHESRRGWWTSGKDEGREGEWYWAATLNPVYSFVWNPHQPSGVFGRNCLVFFDIAGYDITCTSDNYFPLCEREM